MNMETQSISLTLKWGTIKGYNVTNSDKGKELIKEYRSLGYSLSTMAQRMSDFSEGGIYELEEVIEDLKQLI